MSLHNKTAHNVILIALGKTCPPGFQLTCVIVCVCSCECAPFVNESVCVRVCVCLWVGMQQHVCVIAVDMLTMVVATSGRGLLLKICQISENSMTRSCQYTVTSCYGNNV